MSARQQYQGSGSPLPIALLAQAIRKLSRHELEAVTERLIERLDELDGEADFEDDDPAGTDLDAGEYDVAEYLSAEPTYGIDQRQIIKSCSFGEVIIRVDDFQNTP